MSEPKKVALVLRVGDEEIGLMSLGGETAAGFTDERWAKFLEAFANANGIRTHSFHPHQGMVPLLKRVAAKVRELLK